MVWFRTLLIRLVFLAVGISSYASARPIAFVPQNAKVVTTKRLVLQANNKYLSQQFDPSEPLCWGFPGDGNPGPLFMKLNREAKYFEARVTPVPKNDVVIEANTVLSVVDVQVERDVPFPNKFRKGDCKSFDFTAEALGTLTLETKDHLQIVIKGFFFHRYYSPDVSGTDTMVLQFLDLDTSDLEKYTGIQVNL